MNKLLEVREFDTLTCNTDYRNDTCFKYLDKGAFQNLTEMIHRLAGDEEHADILNFMRIGYKRNVGEIITLRNYVGLIQMQNGFQLQILPKIDFGQEDISNVRTKKVFLKMLRSMKDFPSKHFHDAGLRVDRMHLYEIFINMYLQEVRQLVKHGMKCGYVVREENLNYCKGKLMIGQHIRTNLAHKERFYISYEEFNANRPENKLVKATLEKLQRLTTSAENAKEVRQLLLFFELVESSVNYQKDFSRISINRNNKEYELLMQWSEVFLLNRSFTVFSGKTSARAMLFPMETVYESYIARQMQKAFCPDGWAVSVQDKKHCLFTEPRKQFALRPDIVLTREHRIIVMDTKWKRLSNDENRNYGISQRDMYQMYAYSKKYGTSEIWLLYPTNSEMKYHQDICFNSGDGTKVSVYFTDVEHIEESVQKLKEKLK